MRVALDPETGELVQVPEDELDSPRRRMRTYSGDLVQEALPQGGFKVDLKGRFESAVVATVDPETDEVTVDCVQDHGTGEKAHEHEHSE